MAFLFFFCGLLLLANQVRPNCVLPRIEEPINLNMVPGEWFVNHFSSPNDLKKVFTCAIVANIRQIDDDVYLEFRDVKSVSNTGDPNYEMMALHYVPYNNITNWYLLDEKYESLSISEVQDATKNDNLAEDKAALNELHHIFDEPMLLYTDYKKFLVIMLCIGDSKIIWVYGRRPEEMNNEMGLVRQFLTDVGYGWDEVSFQPSACPGMNIRSSVLN